MWRKQNGVHSYSKKRQSSQMKGNCGKISHTLFSIQFFFFNFQFPHTKIMSNTRRKILQWARRGKNIIHNSKFQEEKSHTGHTTHRKKQVGRGFFSIFSLFGLGKTLNRISCGSNSRVIIEMIIIIYWWKGMEWNQMMEHSLVVENRVCVS
jgi:hypothetical protein